MHEAGETEEPSWWPELIAVTVALADDELGQVDDEPRGVTEQEHDHDTNQHRRQIDFVSTRAVAPITPDVSIPQKKTSIIHDLNINTIHSLDASKNGCVEIDQSCHG